VLRRSLHRSGFTKSLSSSSQHLAS